MTTVKIDTPPIPSKKTIKDLPTGSYFSLAVREHIGKIYLKTERTLTDDFGVKSFCVNVETGVHHFMGMSVVVGTVYEEVSISLK